MKQDQDIYKKYQKIEKPEYFQRYFMAWYVLHNDAINPIDLLRVKVRIYQKLGISDEEICKYQTIIKRSKMLSFIHGGEVTNKQAESIYRQMPSISEMFNSEAHYLDELNIKPNKDE